ncbi:MFS transporter [Leptolyngbya sp. AN02str]|uniref:MFS transporter n=1 Tax=Leptolyngbya sp. AN02str TaxID=3423363 RepID=UPI003D312CFA
MEYKPQARVLWLQVWALAAVQGAIALMWVIYNLYIPQLLTAVGVSAVLAGVLILIENGLSALMEPLMGNFSDRAQRWVGSRFPFISAGVALTSVLFLGLPAIAIFGANSPIARWVLIFIAIAWALAMTVFRSPALSLLGRYAIGTNLSQAASILTLVGAVVGAVAPFASERLVQLGAPLTFGLGTGVLLGSAAVLRAVHPPEPMLVTSSVPGSDRIRWRFLLGRLVGLFCVGMGVAVGFRLMMQVFPAVLSQLPNADDRMILALIFVAIAITAIPAGTLATRLGNVRALLLGLSAIAVCVLLLLMVRNVAVAAILAIALGACFSLVSNGSLPFALSLVPPNKAGLGTGTYFGGAAIGTSIFFSRFGNLPTTSGIIVGAIAYAFAAACVLLVSRE